MHVGRPELSIRTDVTEDPETLCRILHEYTHYLSLATPLGLTFDTLLLNCAKLEEMLREFGVERVEASENLWKVTKFSPEMYHEDWVVFASLKMLVDLQLKFYVLYLLWRPLLEGFAVLSEIDVSHAEGEYATEIVHLLAALLRTGKAMSREVTTKLGEELDHGIEKGLNEKEIAEYLKEVELNTCEKFAERQMQQFEHNIRAAQRWSVEHDHFIEKMDTGEFEPHYCVGYYYIRHLALKLSRKDPRLRNLTLFYIFFLHLLESSFSRINPNYLSLEYDEFVRYVSTDFFERLAQLEEVSDHVLREAIDDIRNSLVSAQGQPYDLWKFILTGAKNELQLTLEDARNYFISSTAEILSKNPALVMYDGSYIESSTDDFLKFLQLALYEIFAEEECAAVIVGVYLAIILKGSVMVFVSNQTEAVSDFVLHLRSSGDKPRIKLLQVIKWQPSEFPLYLSTYVIQCDDELFSIDPQFSDEDIDKMKDRFSREFHQLRMSMKVAGTFDSKSLRRLVEEILQYVASESGTTNSYALLLQDATKKWDSTLSFNERVLRSYLAKFLLKKLDSDLWNEFLKKRLMIIATHSLDRQILSELMRSRGKPTTGKLVDALGTNIQDVEQSLGGLQKASREKFGTDVLRPLDANTWKYQGLVGLD